MVDHAALPRDRTRIRSHIYFVLNLPFATSSMYKEDHLYRSDAVVLRYATENLVHVKAQHDSLADLEDSRDGCIPEDGSFRAEWKEVGSTVLCTLTNLCRRVPVRDNPLKKSEI